MFKILQIFIKIRIVTVNKKITKFYKVNNLLQLVNIINQILKMDKLHYVNIY